MAFNHHNLSIQTYGNGFTLWHYKDAKEKMEAICTADYFLSAPEKPARGDMIMINALDGGGIRVVTISDETTVALATLI